MILRLPIVTCSAIVLGALFVPGLASAENVPVTPLPLAGQVYIYPDQVELGTAMQAIKFEIKNTSDKNWYSISFQTPSTTLRDTVSGSLSTTHSADVKITDADYPYTYLADAAHGQDYIVFGSLQDKLNIAPGDTFTVTLTTNIGNILKYVDGVGWVPDNDQTHTNSDYWQFTTAHADLFNNSTFYSLSGNRLFTITWTPKPSARPFNFGVTNVYSNGLNGSGISDPNKIHGLFPPGPVDSLILLPVTLAQMIFDSASNPGGVVAPTVDIFGYHVTFGNGQAIYNGLGGGVSALLTTALSFFILLPWVKHLYARLQRATSLETHSNDTWGVL